MRILKSIQGKHVFMAIGFIGAYLFGIAFGSASIEAVFSLVERLFR